jgi:hypothetical protein
VKQLFVIVVQVCAAVYGYYQCAHSLISDDCIGAAVIATDSHKSAASTVRVTRRTAKRMLP